MNDNVHYLHDVVMGATIGMAFGYALWEKQDSDDSSALLISPLDGGSLLSFNYRFD